MSREQNSRNGSQKRSRSAFSLVELAITLVVAGLLAGAGASQYGKYIEKARITQAIAEIYSIANVIEAAQAWDESPYPDDLSGLNLEASTDPWGNPYHYLRIDGVFAVTRANQMDRNLPSVAAGVPRPTPDSPRKDRFFKPISTDFDLYSSGPDGVSRDSLEHRDSRDDIVRALNGQFIGPAERF